MHIATRVAVFLLILNSSAVALDKSGVAEDWGVDPNLGVEEDIKDLNKKLGSISPARGLGSTLFTMYTSVTKTFQIVFNFVFAGPTMLGNLGAPDWLTALVFAPQYVIAGSGIAYSLFGRRV